MNNAAATIAASSNLIPPSDYLYPLQQALTCSHCLGIMQNPASLPCNHHFCMSCLVQSLRKMPACAKCKYPAIARQAKLSPEVADIVAAYKQLEARIVQAEKHRFPGEHVCSSLKRSRQEDPLESPDKETSLTNLTNWAKTSFSTDVSYRGTLPASKRIQLPHPYEPIDKQSPLMLEEKGKDLSDDQTSVSAYESEQDQKVDARVSCEEEELLREDERNLREGLASNGLSKMTPSESRLDPAGMENDSVSQGCNVGGDSAFNATLPKTQDATDEKECCAFCYTSDSQIAGPMMRFEKDFVVSLGRKKTGRISCVHKNCAEWAPHVYYVDDVPKNVPQEVVRGLKIKCHVCGLRGAVLGCYVTRCRKSFHYPCAHSLACRWDHNNFLVLCPEHVSSKFPGENAKTPETEANNVFSNEHKLEAFVSTTQTSTPCNADICSDVYVPTMEASTASAHGPHVDENDYVCLPIAGDFTSKPLMVKPISHGVSLSPTNIGSTVEQCPGNWKTSQWVLCGSDLSPKENDMLDSLARHTGVKIQKTWTPSVTHLIAGTDESGAARRTFKYLMANVEGKWILRADWLYASIAAGMCVHEESFEVNIDIHGMVGGPRHARAVAAAKVFPLFHELRFYILGCYKPAYRANLEALLTAAGGTIICLMPDALLHPGSTAKDVVIYCEDVSHSEVSDRDAVIRERYLEAQSYAALIGAEVAGHTWILDSIAASQLQPFE